jgi:hypothetical protein
MGIAPLAFTGVSQYSSDFQTILNRAVQVAQIPINLLQNKDSDLLQQKTPGITGNYRCEPGRHGFEFGFDGGQRDQ